MLTRWEKIEHNKIKLEIEVDASEVDKALDRAYRSVVRKVSLPGFRKGRVPRRVLEAHFGPGVLHQDALELLIPPAYEKAISEVDEEPIDHPQFDFETLEQGEPFQFEATVEVMPSVELGEYKGVAVEQVENEITEEDLERHLESLQEQHARLVTVEEEDQAAGEGDLALIDFRGFIGGGPFPGGEAENYSLELGSKTFIPGFEEQVVGMKRGEEKEITVTFPEDYHEEEFAGKEALFKVTLKEIKQKKLPALDDDFVKEISDFETLFEFRVDLRERLEKAAAAKAKTDLEEALVKKVTDASQVELPSVLVERQIDRMLGEMEQYLRYQGLTLEKFVELSGRSVEELREEKRAEAEARTKANLVLDAVVKKEGFTVDDAEIDAEIAALSERHQDDPERIRDIFEKQGRIPLLKEELRIRKAIDLLVREAKIEKVKKAE